MLLSKGILLNNGKTWLSVNNNGESCELISATEFSSLRSEVNRSTPESRFSEVSHLTTSTESFTAKVRTHFLSPGVTYAIRLVFQYRNPPTRKETVFINIEYKHSKIGDWRAHRAEWRGDGWLMTELCQFTSCRKKVGFEIGIKFSTTLGFSSEDIILEGIEFQPVEKETIEETEDFSAKNELLLSDSNSNWEQKLPNDYLNIIKRSKDIFIKQERNLFHNLCCWFWEPEYQWFSLDGNGGRCLMLPPKLFLPEPKGDNAGHCSLTWEPFPFLRFPVVAHVWNFNMVECLQIRYDIDSKMLSPGTRYAAYLVYLKPFEDRFESLLFVLDKNYIEDRRVVYFMDAQTPVIELKHDQWCPQGLSTTKRKGHQTRRPDRGMEVKIWEFTTGFDAGDIISMALELCNPCYFNFKGLMVGGIEFRPV